MGYLERPCIGEKSILQLHKKFCNRLCLLQTIASACIVYRLFGIS